MNDTSTINHGDTMDHGDATMESDNVEFVVGSDGSHYRDSISPGMNTL